jgi:hypothetical protein
MTGSSWLYQPVTEAGWAKSKTVRDVATVVDGATVTGIEVVAGTRESEVATVPAGEVVVPEAPHPAATATSSAADVHRGRARADRRWARGPRGARGGRSDGDDSTTLRRVVAAVAMS